MLSSDEHLVVAYFPTSTLDQDPGSKIASISRNLSDGRIRCEIKDSTIHAREETSEGIPVDYHMVWESSTAPTNTFREDYFAVKKNGKVFLTPAQFVHMRAVVEPKGSRQENLRVGIVVQNNLREAQNAGKLTADAKTFLYKFIHVVLYSNTSVGAVDEVRPSKNIE